MAIAAIILAAGAGTRMKSALPKVLHKVAGLPLLGHVVGALRAAGVERIVVVTSAAGEAVREYAKAMGCDSAVQHQQLGTGHAAASAVEALKDFSGTLLIVNGDMPLVTADTIAECLKAQVRTGLSLLAFQPADAAHYGRVLMTPDGFLNRIVEYKDASEAERGITLCNAGCYAADARKFFHWASQLKSGNAQGEYYLTDVPAIARPDGVKCAIAMADEVSVTGVNSRAELAAAEKLFQDRARARLLEGGVTMTAPETVFFSYDTEIAPGVTIEPNVVFGEGVSVAAGAVIRAFSYLEGAHVGQGALIGPYARLRPGADIGKDAHIGNFVEVKNVKVGEGAKANHLSYLGDGSVGAGSNIGAGTIFCNYDGFFKYQTVIGERAFIGSNTSLVAPVTVGDGAMTGSGSVITRDVPADALAFERNVQTDKLGWAKAFRAKKAAEKTASKK